MKSIKFFSFVLILSLFTVISAGATPWTAAGSTGTVDEAHLDQFRVTNYKIHHKPNKTGIIVAYYNVTNPFDFTPVHANWNYLGVRYTDTEPGIPVWVRAYLKRVRFSNGDEDTITVFYSDAHPIGTHYRVKYFNHDFDFQNYAYYIQVIIFRNSVSKHAVLHSLKLGWSPFVPAE